MSKKILKSKMRPPSPLYALISEMRKTFLACFNFHKAFLMSDHVERFRRQDGLCSDSCKE
jgi:hypothetical protein